MDLKQHRDDPDFLLLNRSSFYWEQNPFTLLIELLLTRVDHELNVRPVRCFKPLAVL